MRALVGFGGPLTQADNAASIAIAIQRSGTDGVARVMKEFLWRCMGSLLFSLCPSENLQAFELLLIGSREFIAEQLAEISFGILDHIMELVAIEFPIAQPRRRGE